MCKRCNKKKSQINIQQSLNDPNFQLMTDILSLTGRLVKQKPEFFNVTDTQREMIEKLGEVADAVKKQQEENVRKN